MKKTIILFFALACAGAITAQTRLNGYQRVTSLNDTDLFIYSKQAALDSTRNMQARYVCAYMNQIKDTTPNDGARIYNTTGYRILAIHSTSVTALSVVLPTYTTCCMPFEITTDRTITSFTLVGTTVSTYSVLPRGTPIRLIYDQVQQTWFDK